MQIQKFFPTDYDKKQLAQYRKNNIKNNSINYNDMIVEKPCGYENLLFCNREVEVWNLYIKHKGQTSMHCHPDKKTALIVIEGKARFSTLRETADLGPYDSVIIDSGVFHSTESLSLEGIRVIEVETPGGMKHNIYRLQDKYGRSGKSYEGKDKMHLDTEKSTRFPTIDRLKFFQKIISKSIIEIRRIQKRSLFETDIHFDTDDFIVILGGSIPFSEQEISYGVADIVQVQDLNLLRHVPLEDVTFMRIKSS